MDLRSQLVEAEAAVAALRIQIAESEAIVWIVEWDGTIVPIDERLTHPRLQGTKVDFDHAFLGYSGVIVDATMLEAGWYYRYPTYRPHDNLAKIFEAGGTCGVSCRNRRSAEIVAKRLRKRCAKRPPPA